MDDEKALSSDGSSSTEPKESKPRSSEDYDKIIEDEKENDIREAFDLYDDMDEGFIDPGKLFIGTRSLGLNLTEAEVQDLIAAVDTDGSGRIEYQTLSSLIKAADMNEGDVQEIFSTFDRDRNGVIGIEDLQSLSSQLGHDYNNDQLQAILTAADGNVDGAVTYSDFREIFFLTVDEGRKYILNAIRQKQEEEAAGRDSKELLSKLTKKR